MYVDSKPCGTCGSEIELRARDEADATTEPDGTVDERVCTNSSCPTRRAGYSGPPA